MYLCCCGKGEGGMFSVFFFCFSNVIRISLSLLRIFVFSPHLSLICIFSFSLKTTQNDLQGLMCRITTTQVSCTCGCIFPELLAASSEFSSTATPRDHGIGSWQDGSWYVAETSRTFLIPDLIKVQTLIIIAWFIRVGWRCLSLTPRTILWPDKITLKKQMKNLNFSERHNPRQEYTWAFIMSRE